MREFKDSFVYSWGKVAVAAERKTQLIKRYVKKFQKWLPS